MFKKNQLALILLTLVMMLTVYYIKTPSESPNDNNNTETPAGSTTGRLAPLTTMRMAIKGERNEAILALDAIIASSDSTPAQVNAAIEQKIALTELTESELLLELQIIGLGYQDAFVHATGNGVEITVVSDEHSISKANEIILMALSNFNISFNNVCVQFETVDEVMGTIEEGS